LRWNDPDLGIAWPLQGEPILAKKDMQANTFQEIKKEMGVI
jgi:dTDP-4-dehydrorhamnose 3,5-epimerase